MAVVNQDWYNLNESRPYPLADSATALDNEGNVLPSNIITDLRVRWPDWAGKYAFIGSVAVSPSIVTVTVLVATSLDTTSSYIPIAVVSVSIEDFQEGRQYPLESMYPGAFGYITLGSGTTANYSGRFLGPAQTLLTSRAANPHPGLPVTSLNRLNDQTALTGLINLRAEAPLFITKERRVIDGDSKDAIVFSITEDTSKITTEDAIETILQTLAGNCGKRPESGNCGAPEPIEFINSVGPDCNGLFTLEFTGCAVVGRNVSEHVVRYEDLDATSYSDDAIIIDCASDIEDTCAPPYLPQLSDGRLPSEYTPVTPDPPEPPAPPPSTHESVSAPFKSPISLPYCETFEDDVADNFYDVGKASAGSGGAWKFEGATSPEDICRDASISASESVVSSGSYSTNTETGVTSRNMSVWYRGTNDFPDTNQTIYRTFTTDLRIVVNSTDTPLVATADPANVGQSGGLLVNYRINPITGGQTFWVAHVETSTTPALGTFGLYYYNGVQLVKLTYPSGLAAEHSGQDLYPDVWYRLTVDVSLEQNNSENSNVVLRSTLTGPLSPWSSEPVTPQTLTIGAVIVPVSEYENEATYGSDGESGLAGFYARKSATQFSSWRIEDNREDTPQWTL